MAASWIGWSEARLGEARPIIIAMCEAAHWERRALASKRELSTTSPSLFLPGNSTWR